MEFIFCGSLQTLYIIGVIGGFILKVTGKDKVMLDFVIFLLYNFHQEGVFNRKLLSETRRNFFTKLGIRFPNGFTA
ncbi:hypothetical protein ABB05_01925 [Lederbergia galactosidilytica]|uniref:Uncharacterized protein n=1 Tax=Lederbergia galactosidilytica TaxID=217031 RepID=A0A178A8Y1_9BACI|nr:hypothetical protein ABB05_01925 [Lederbergia galactosidilytica]